MSGCIESGGEEGGSNNLAKAFIDSILKFLQPFLTFCSLETFSVIKMPVSLNQDLGTVGEGGGGVE